MSKPDAVAGAAPWRHRADQHAPRHEQTRGEDHHREDQPEAGADHGPEPVAGQVHAHDEQPEDDPGQHAGNGVERVVGGLGAHQGVGLRQFHARMDLGHQIDRGQPRVAEPLLRQVDERREIEEHAVPADHDALAVARQDRVDLVGGPPRVPRSHADANAGLATSSATLSWTNPVTADARVGVKVSSRVDQGRRKPLSLERVDCLVGQPLDVDVLEDRRGDPVGDPGLHVRVVDERADAAHEAVGVGDLVVGPDREAGHRCQDTAEHDQERRQQRAPAELPPGRPATRPQTVDLAPQPLELQALVGGQRACRHGVGLGTVQLGHRRHLSESRVCREDSTPGTRGCHRLRGMNLLRQPALCRPDRSLIPSGRRVPARAAWCSGRATAPLRPEIDMALNEYPAGRRVLRRDRPDDRRVQPRVAAARPARARLAERADRRARRHRLRAARLLRQPDRDAELRRARRERPALHQHAHDGAVLAEPVLHRHRPQPPQQRHGRHHRAGLRLSRLQRHRPVRERLPLGDAARATATARTWSASGT